MVYDLRTGLYSHLQELPYEFYDHNRVGEIMSRMTGDIEGIRDLIAGGIITVFDNSLKFIGGLVFMTFMSWQLTLALIIIAPTTVRDRVAVQQAHPPGVPQHPRAERQC